MHKHLVVDCRQRSVVDCTHLAESCRYLAEGCTHLSEHCTHLAEGCKPLVGDSHNQDLSRQPVVSDELGEPESNPSNNLFPFTFTKTNFTYWTSEISMK